MRNNPGVSTQHLRAGVLSTIVAGIMLTGCSTQAPCLSYSPQLQVRTVSLRGYGSVQVEEEKMVCTRRAETEVYAMD